MHPQGWSGLSTVSREGRQSSSAPRWQAGGVGRPSCARLPLAVTPSPPSAPQPQRDLAHWPVGRQAEHLGLGQESGVGDAVGQGSLHPGGTSWGRVSRAGPPARVRDAHSVIRRGPHSAPRGLHPPAKLPSLQHEHSVASPDAPSRKPPKMSHVGLRRQAQQRSPPSSLWGDGEKGGADQGSRHKRRQIQWAPFTPGPSVGP